MKDLQDTLYTFDSRLDLTNWGAVECYVRAIDKKGSMETYNNLRQNITFANTGGKVNPGPGAIGEIGEINIITPRENITNTNASRFAIYFNEYSTNEYFKVFLGTSHPSYETKGTFSSDVDGYHGFISTLPLEPNKTYHWLVRGYDYTTHALVSQSKRRTFNTRSLITVDPIELGVVTEEEIVKVVSSVSPDGNTPLSSVSNLDLFFPKVNERISRFSTGEDNLRLTFRYYCSSACRLYYRQITKLETSSNYNWVYQNTNYVIFPTLDQLNPNDRNKDIEYEWKVVLFDPLTKIESSSSETRHFWIVNDKLDKPNSLRIEGGNKAVWNPVNGADKYKVFFTRYALRCQSCYSTNCVEGHPYSYSQEVVSNSVYIPPCPDGVIRYEIEVQAFNGKAGQGGSDLSDPFIAKSSTNPTCPPEKISIPPNVVSTGSSTTGTGSNGNSQSLNWNFDSSPNIRYAVTWKNSRGNWKGVGPIQKVGSSWDSEAEVMELINSGCCANINSLTPYKYDGIYRIYKYSCSCSQEYTDVPAFMMQNGIQP